jgi:hypothetical protein
MSSPHDCGISLSSFGSALTGLCILEFLGMVSFPRGSIFCHARPGALERRKNFKTIFRYSSIKEARRQKVLICPMNLDFPGLETGHKTLMVKGGIPGIENVGGDLDKVTGKR